MRFSTKFLTKFITRKATRNVIGVLLVLAAYGLFVMAAGYLELRTRPFEGYMAQFYGNEIATGAIVAVALAALMLKWQPRVPLVVGAVCVLPSLWLSEFGYHLASVCFLIAVLLELFRRRLNRKVVRLRQVFQCAGLFAISLATLDRLYEMFGDNLRTGSFLAFVCRFIPGHLVESDGSKVVLYANDRVIQGNLSIDKLGGVMFLACIAFYLLLAYIYRHKLWVMVRNIALMVAYGTLAAVFYIGASSGVGEVNAFVETGILARLAPMIAAATLLSICKKGPRKPFARANLRWAAAACLLAFGLTAYTLIPTGPARSGTVIIDEAHGGWEPTYLPLTRDTFGSLSVYNYGNFYDELAKHFDVKRCMQDMTDQDLASASVVILKTPSKPFSDALCNRLERFVRRGGGLWLIGDHTDAFGMTTYLNQVASKFDCEFEKNAWLEPPIRRNLWKANEFTPAYLGNIPDFLFYTGCQTDTPPTFQKVAIARRQVFDEPDYAAGSFFGKLRFVPSDAGGNAVMVASGPYGAGRVSLWSDSTLFSDFAIYMPGKLLVGLNTVKWLQCGTDAWYASWRIPVSALCVFAAFLCLGGARFWMLLAAGLALVPLVDKSVSGGPRWFEEADLRGDPEVAVFEPTQSLHYPVLMSVDQPGPYYYLTAFVALQRAGARPFILHQVSEFRKGGTCLWVPDGRAITHKTLKELADWVRDGGHLMLLDGGNGGPEKLGWIYDAFGGRPAVGQTLDAPQWVTATDSGKRDLGTAFVMGFLKGDHSTIQSNAGSASIGGTIRFGKGSVYLTPTATFFSDDNIGNCHYVPSKMQRAIIQQIYDAVDAGLAGHKPTAIAEAK